MKGSRAVLAAALLTAGCQTPMPTFDPFAGRTTVPPPGTGTISPPSVEIPYYQGAPPPGSPPAATPPPNTVPPGGYNYPQSKAEPSASAPSYASNSAPSSTEPAIRVPDDSKAARIRPAAVAQAMPTAPRTQPLALQPSSRPVAAPHLPPQRTLQGQANPAPLPSNPAPRPVTYAAQPAPQPIPQRCAPVAIPCQPSPFIPSREAVEITQLPAARASRPTSTGRSASTASTGFVARASHEQADFQPPAYRYGYESKNYSWLKGELQYLQSTRKWKLRYIPIDGETDAYGGSVEIANADALAGFQPGDHVTLYGRVTREPSGASFAPLYTVERAERL